MKLTVERAALLNSLAHLQGVVERRNTIPILSNVLLEAEGKALSLTATDFDICITESVTVKVAKPGATTVPAHTLYDIVRKLPEGAEVEMSYAAGEQRLTLRAERASFHLSCLPKEDFPVTTAGDLPYQFALPAAALKRLIEKTRFAISTEETRYYLNGIYLHVAAGAEPTLRAVATDGHRLARIETPLPAGAAGMPGVIVPRKAIGELSKLLDGVDAAVEVSVSPTKIRFAFNNVILLSKLIDGTFPDYERVIPSANNKVLEVNCRIFQQAVDRVSTISTEKSRAIRLALDKNRVVLSANSPEQGTASDEVTASYAAQPLEIGFNARYLMDITSQIDGENARFTLADAASPTLVRDGDDASALYVLMPMRV
jgi:DNA polymerase-3 subunit beta